MSNLSFEINKLCDYSAFWCDTNRTQSVIQTLRKLVMKVSLGIAVSIQARYLQQRGSVFQFVMRVPADLVKRYGKQFVRISLKTSNGLEAVKKTEVLAKKYLAQFQALQDNPKLTPVEVTTTARELAESWGTMAHFIEHVVEPKQDRYANGDEHVHREADPSEYLKPIELEAGRLLREGLDTVRLSDALSLYWKNHRRSGDPEFVVGVERDWNKLMSLVGNIPVVDLSRAQARQFIEHLTEQGLKTTSVRRNLNHVVAIFRSAIREAELTKQNPFEGLKISGEGEDAKEASVPTRETLQDIAQTFRSDTSGTALLSLILMETGTRIAEFSGMKVSDVFLDAPVPYARIKPNEWRGVKTISSVRDFPSVGITLEAVKTALKLPRKNDAIFPQYGNKSGNTNASAAVNKRLQRWGITSKSFRHSLKDRLREVGCPKDVRDAIQGHENGDIAETYGLGHTLQTMQDWLEKAKTVLPAI
jgi:integrase